MEKSSRHRMVWKNTQNLPKSPLFVEDSENSDDDDLWLPSQLERRNKSNFQQNEIVGEQLKKEGILLAEKGYFKEALTKWNGSICHIPKDFTLHEMQAQALMMLDKDMASVQAAERSVALNKIWHEGWHTLARAQLNIQDPTMALKSFSRALHLCPSEGDIKDELLSTLLLIKKMLQPRELDPAVEHENGEEER